MKEVTLIDMEELVKKYVNIAQEYGITLSIISKEDQPPSVTIDISSPLISGIACISNLTANVVIKRRDNERHSMLNEISDFDGFTKHDLSVFLSKLIAVCKIIVNN